MREKLQTLPLTELRELAKSQKIKGGSTMRKAELIEVLCEAAQQEEIIKTAVAPPSPKPQAQPQPQPEGKADERNMPRAQRPSRENR